MKLPRLFRGFSLRQRFLVAPVLGLAVCSLLTAAFLYESRSQNELLGRMEGDLTAFNRYAEIFANLTEQHTALDVLLDAAGKIDDVTLYDRARHHLDKVRSAVEDLEQAVPSVDAGVTADAALRQELSANAQAYWKAASAMVAMATVNPALAPDHLAHANERFTAMNRSFIRLVGLERRRISTEAATRVRESGIRNMAIAGAGVSTAALLFFLSLFLSRVLSRSIATQIGILTALGAQAGARAPAEGNDEVERMTQAIAAFRQSLLGMRRLNRVYAVLSGINTLIVRVRDRDELFRDAIRIAVEHGEFRMAWIGMTDRDSGVVKPIAFAGDVRDFFEFVPLALAEGEGRDFGLVGEALRDLKPMIVNDVRTDPRRLLKDKLAERGINSLAVMPLIVDGKAIGVFSLYSADTGCFDEEEMRLLQELAGDISFAIDHIEKRDRLDFLAYYDALTGLANRTLFLERLGQYKRSAASAGHKLALFLVDLERFKNINDTLGRPAGDALLKQVAEWLTRNVGDASVVARVGADQFAVVLPQVRQDGSVAGLVEKTVEAFLSHPFHLDDTVFRIAAKVGVAVFPDDGADADTLFKNAEAALKKAKAGGERYLFYTQKMTESVSGKLTLETQLRQALDKEEFVLHYQPKVSLATGKVIGAEALIRWNDPRTGLVPPGHFIPVLEETGLIYEVGRWALRKAIEDYLRWRAAGLAAVRIAVNVSPLQLRSRGFIAEIERVIGIDARAAAGLELEITEGVIMEDVKNSTASLHAIRAMGVSIAIDDFGTGFSSLSYLAKLPVDALKIDRSFIVDMTSGPQGLALVSTIIKLAHSLKLTVVAEGVETDEQSRLLRLLSCDEMQGYLFSKPVPAEVLETKFLAAPLSRDGPGAVALPQAA